MSKTATRSLELYGKDLHHEHLKEGYETDADFSKQGDTRVVKALQFPVHVKAPSPMFPDAEVFKEIIYNRGAKVTVEQLGLIALEKGERLGAFFTDAELAAGVPGLPAQPVKVSSEELANTAQLNELGEAELALWLAGSDGKKAPSVQQVLDATGEDSNLAKRLIEAENQRDKDDPRKTLLEGLTKIAES